MHMLNVPLRIDLQRWGLPFALFAFFALFSVLHESSYMLGSRGLQEWVDVDTVVVEWEAGVCMLGCRTFRDQRQRHISRR